MSSICLNEVTLGINAMTLKINAKHPPFYKSRQVSCPRNLGKLFGHKMVRSQVCWHAPTRGVAGTQNITLAKVFFVEYKVVKDAQEIPILHLSVGQLLDCITTILQRKLRTSSEIIS